MISVLYQVLLKVATHGLLFCGNITILNLLCVCILWWSSSELRFLCVLWYHQLKRAVVVTVADCKTVLFMFDVPLGMSCFKNCSNSGITNSGKCFSKGLVLRNCKRLV